MRYSSLLIMGGALGIATLAGCTSASPPTASSDTQEATGDDWPGYGGAVGEQHFSGLNEINDHTVGGLKLAWSLDLDAANTVTQPLAVNGVVFVTTGYSVIRAIQGSTGKVLWTFDADVPGVAPRKIRTAWGSRGIAYWDGKIYAATVDGRLIAVDASNGKQLWSTQTVDTNGPLYITGAPRVFDGKVIIGNGGADIGDVRGYVTTYDAQTGKQLWRFYTVPGNPALGFENAAMKMAARTWAGEWWKYGGGGTVWNAITYDPDFDTVYIGVGNGSPWNRKIRSADKGDNLFLSSIVALDAKTGAYKWHYQVNPGETWDYNAAMDITLATLPIDGKPRKVLMHAPKNGFVYVIDRATGKLISAKPFVKTTWASSIDLATGRPVENPAARYPNGTSFDLYPASFGAHTWLPMAYSRDTHLLYIPTAFLGSRFNDKGIDPKTWKRYPGLGADGGASGSIITEDPAAQSSALTAWNPITQTRAWQVKTVGPSSGAVMATSGNLVFQGQVDGTFAAYAADSGKRLWSFASQAPVLAPPISYRANGRQYITVLTGLGTGSAALGVLMGGIKVDFSQARRVLTFSLNGNATIPAATPIETKFPEDPGFDPATPVPIRAMITYGRRCTICHGINMVAAGQAPDLRKSTVPRSFETFAQVVRGGALVSQGMPKFEELDDTELKELMTLVLSQTAAARRGPAAVKPAAATVR